MNTEKHGLETEILNQKESEGRGSKRESGRLAKSELDGWRGIMQSSTSTYKPTDVLECQSNSFQCPIWSSSIW